MVRCGNCKEDHRDTLAVRECYQGAGKINSPVPVNPAQATTWPPSDAQVKYVLGLQEERNLPEGHVLSDETQLKAMDRDRVSGLIVMLRELSRKEGKAGGNWEIPEGRYALQAAMDDVWRFYEVTTPTEGRWNGYTFIKLLIGSPGDYTKVAMEPARRNQILREINNDPKQAGIDYGLQSRECGRCSSPLTDPDSIARGIGPVCAKKSGWA